MSMYTEIHTHGGYGINFNSASVDDIVEFSCLIFKRGIDSFCPTLATDTKENLKKQIKNIKEASLKTAAARILGIHLEAIYLNPEKKGIHPLELLEKPSIEHYQDIEDDFIRIVTLAPELEGSSELIEYLHKKGVKVQAGHTKATSLNSVDGITHLFNAMDGISHKYSSTASLALNSDIYTEVIADGVHICDEVLKIIFKVKNPEKLILISDSLPIAHFEGEKIIFCNHEVFRGGKSSDGTLAGSSMFLDEIVERIVSKGLLKRDEAIYAASDVPLRFLGL